MHSYFFYPLLLWISSRNKKPNHILYESTEEFPAVTILLAAHNEEEVIAQKIESTVKTSFPISKLEILIGSDYSNDQTEKIIDKYSSEFPFIKLFRFNERSGKIAIINKLVKKASGEILLLTDANVFFTENTITQLVKHFKNPAIAVVAGTIQNQDVKRSGIAKQESSYQLFENGIKYQEGVLWGAMMGAFGGCYAVRKSFFSPTPSNFIVDDFYITLAALEKGGKAISEPSAICYEDVSHLMTEEFRRKSRIGAGNFQILGRFWRLLSPTKGGMAFAFFSHKVLRWFGPFFIIGAYLSSFALSFSHPFYCICFWVQTALLLISVVDSFLSKLNVHLFGLRYISHFYIMNLALLNGFFKFITGIEHNVWQPTQRNQG
jgi:cellulose synthase/poly-beta-1,6-N-acetylglucosamine synthase-like glycosyltransferase